MDEISVGDSSIADLRIKAVAGIPIIGLTTEAETLAATILSKGILPAKAAIDISHIAVSAIHKVDFC